MDKTYEIMIVDDVQENLMLLRELLKASGYKVRSAIDGESALMGIAAKHPDLILLDIKMPGIDGYEVCRRLKQDKTTAEIPILFLSALSETEDKIRAFESGGLDYIAKPFEPAEVLARVRTHLELYRMQNHLEEEVRQRTNELRDVYAMLTRLEEQYHSVVQSFEEDFFFYNHNTEGKLTYVSPSVTHILGYEPQEFLSHFTDYMTDHPDNSIAKQAFDKVLSGVRHPCYQLQIRHKDGSKRWLEVKELPVLNNEYQVTEVRGIAQDITQRKSTEEALRVQVQKTSVILSSAGEGIFGLDKEGNHTFVNPAAASMLGYSEQELMGKPSHRTWHYEHDDGTHYPDEECPIYRTLKTAEPTSGEESFIRKDGSHFTVNFTSRPIIEDNQCIGAVVSFMDVSAQKQAEFSYQQEQEKVKNALKQTVTALASATEIRDAYTAGHQNNVAELSAAIAEEMGLDEQSIEGIRFGGYIHNIGNVYIPAEILNFPGKLDDNRLAIIKTHPEVGCDIIKGVEFPWPVEQIIHQHHERIDGSGYPQGLKGDEISLEAKIIAVADVVAAMMSHRPYRAALSQQAALDEIKQSQGVLYDPVVVDSCVLLFEKKGYRLDNKTGDSGESSS